ncbi:hypothetical protein, partial [Candidatus Methanodesulfokora washburnensis]|uniref:hypothetical protein n=1 Tax=Candidatus Methanodesulfokora washburnensis TaxID=2478471 RepID=UPI00105A1E3A
MQFSKERAPQGSALQALKRDIFSKVGLQDPNIPYVARAHTVQYSCEPEAERVLDLYREYYESYIGISRFPVERKPKVILSFKASWYLNDLSVEFDGFSLRIKAEGDLRKAFEIMQLLEGRIIRVEI